jgi:hypothetical protein
MNNIEQLIGLLNRFKLSFYHFTDERNLCSIREHGLLSMRELRQRGISPVAGGNQWSLDADLRAGMDAYVHLCFLRQHPMEWSARQDGRIERSRFLRVEPEVLTLPGVMITDQVSNKSGVLPKPADDMIPGLDFKVMYTRTDWKDPAIQARRQRAKLYEILVPTTVPPDFIANLS